LTANPADAPWMASNTKRATVMNVENIFVQNDGGEGGGEIQRGILALLIGMTLVITLPR